MLLHNALNSYFFEWPERPTLILKVYKKLILHISTF